MKFKYMTQVEKFHWHRAFALFPVVFHREGIIIWLEHYWRRAANLDRFGDIDTWDICLDVEKPSGVRSYS